MKKTIRLTEADLERLVKKILKEEQDFDDFGFGLSGRGKTPDNFLYNLMQGLEMSESKKAPGWTLYKDEGKILMASNPPQHLPQHTLYVDYNKIWKKLKEMGLNDREIEQLCIKALNDVFNRKVTAVTPSRALRIPYLLFPYFDDQTENGGWGRRHMW